MYENIVYFLENLNFFVAMADFYTKMTVMSTFQANTNDKFRPFL